LLRSFQPLPEQAVFGYVKVFAANLAQDYFKASRAKKRGGSYTTDSLEVQTEKEGVQELRSTAAIVERKVLVDEVSACLDQIVMSSPSSQRDRRIFWLYYRAGLAASEIAALPTIRLNTKGVESTILRLSRMVRQRLAMSRQPDARTAGPIEGIGHTESL